MQNQPTKISSLNIALRIIDDAWDELRRSFFVQRQLGVIPARLPDVSFTEAQRRAELGRSLLKRIDAFDQRSLPHDLALTMRLVRFRAQSWSREDEWYWLAIDPLGTGIFALFCPTAYCSGWLLNFIHSQLASFQFLESGDADRYLALVADYTRLIDQLAARTAGQAERGILMPKVQVHRARALLERFKSGVGQMVGVAAERITFVQGASFAHELDRRIAVSVKPAFERALAGLSDAYCARAPDSVGLGQYPGGAEVYAELVKLHTTLDLSAEEVHARGQARIAEIEAQKRAIWAELGFQGDEAAFLAHLGRNPRWQAKSVEDVTTAFQAYIDRLKPRFNECFSSTPNAAYEVAPLPAALEGSMTYGYYDPPRKDHLKGHYFFNAENLLKRPLLTVGTLTYHELMPGHHLHLATQQENESLRPFRKYCFVNAYNEGWAEYAASLVGEMGVYEHPEERYGRLMMDAFLTCRLVVDTGMNALGWTLERARDYMRSHGGLGESEILSDSVRYSCDIPGQALAYKLGDIQILGMRERMRRALGARFDLKDFHTTILGPGALPLPDLEWHVEREIERLIQRE